MSCLRRCLISLLCLLFLAAGATAGTVWFASDWLVRTDAPAGADAIVVLSGDVLRAFYAAELYRAGMAPQIVLTVERRGAGNQKLDELGVPFPRTEHLYRDVLVKLGVPASAVRTVGNELASTAAEAAAISAAFAPETRLLIVTSPHHTRRAHMIFSERFPASSIRMVSDPREQLPRRWWSDQDAARNVLLEFAKTAWFRLGGRF